MVGAIEHYQKAITYKPDYAKAYFQMGLSFQQLRRDFDALECFQNAVKLTPNDSEMLAKLGDHLLVKQDWKESIAVLEKAVEIDPNAMEGFARLCHARQLVCDWSSYQHDLDLLWKDAEIKIGKGECPAVGPFQSLTLPWSLDRLQMIARMHSAKTKVKSGLKSYINLMCLRMIHHQDYELVICQGIFIIIRSVIFCMVFSEDMI